VKVRIRKTDNFDFLLFHTFGSPAVQVLKLLCNIFASREAEREGREKRLDLSKSELLKRLGKQKER
jgi:hypothetical protein